MVFDYIYRTDADSNEYVLVVAFESKEAYEANAANPAQHAQYLRYRELMESDPTWSDGEIVYAYPGEEMSCHYRQGTSTEESC